MIKIGLNLRLNLTVSYLKGSSRFRVSGFQGFSPHAYSHGDAQAGGDLGEWRFPQGVPGKQREHAAAPA